MSTSFQINQALPVEIFTIIFSFINPSPEDLHPHLPLSCVCRRWRSIIVDNPQFWTILEFRGDYEHDVPPKHFFHHSTSHKLHIFVSPTVLDIDSNKQELPPRFEARVRSFFLRGSTFFPIDGYGWRNFAFPQLENLSWRGADMSTTFLINLITGSRLRRLAFSSYMLLDLDTRDLLRHLSNIEWLSLNLSAGPQLTRVFEILSTKLPNLRTLNISIQGIGLWQNVQTTTLPKVRILTLEGINGNFPFNIPNLGYLCLLRCRPLALEIEAIDAQLGSIDLSQIKRIRVGLHEHMIKDACDLDDHSKHDVCMSGMTHSSVDCASFERFHKEGMISQAIAIENNLNFAPQNTLHLPIPWRTKPEIAFAFLQRMTNLTELTLDYGSLKHSLEYYKYYDFFYDLLRSAVTIVRLNIMHARGFVQACRALKRGDTAPCLERLTCHSSSHVKATAFLPRHIKLIQDARVRTASQPLKVLELRNFSVLPDDRLKEIAKMGVQVIQS